MFESVHVWHVRGQGKVFGWLDWLKTIHTTMIYPNSVVLTGPHNIGPTGPKSQPAIHTSLI